MKGKASELNQKIEQKYPKIHHSTTSTFSYIKEVWQETFPDPDGKVKSRINKRKEVAAKMKAQSELSPEELEKLEGEIPEWKKGAVVLQE